MGHRKIYCLAVLSIYHLCKLVLIVWMLAIKAVSYK